MLLHAPAGVVHLGLASENRRNGAALGPRVTAVDLELPVGVLAAHEDEGTHLEPYFGVGVSVWWLLLLVAVSPNGAVTSRSTNHDGDSNVTEARVRPWTYSGHDASTRSAA